MNNGESVEIVYKKLLKELSDTIRAEKVAKTIDIEQDEFLHNIKKQLNAQLITRNEYRHLSGLYKFMNVHPELKDGQIQDLISLKPLAFWFLNQCVRNIRDFLPELRKNGVNEMAIEVATRHALRIFSDEI